MISIVTRPDLVQDGRVYNGTQRQIIKRPSENPSGGLVETLSTLEKQKEREGGDGARMKLRIREMNPPIHQG
jgi:hypothetical protein